MKNSEILRERIGTLREVDEYVGRYYSVEWVRKNILMQNDEDIEEIIKQIDAEDVDVDKEKDDVDLAHTETDLPVIEEEIEEDESVVLERGVALAESQKRLFDSMTKLLDAEE
jgi:hypothetical protein